MASIRNLAVSILRIDWLATSPQHFVAVLVRTIPSSFA
jgi:hypothetical protein